MKTRADIYGQEATELLRLISLYPGLIQCQLAGFFPARTAPLSMACSPILNGRAGPSKVSAAAGSLMVKTPGRFRPDTVGLGTSGYNRPGGISFSWRLPCKSHLLFRWRDL